MGGYFKLPNSSDEELNCEKINNSEQHQPCSPSTASRLLPWIWCAFCTIITGVAVLNSIFQQGQCQASQSSNSRGSFPTDFITAPEIPYIEKYYYNYWDFNPYKHRLELNHTMLKVGPMYAGPPSPEIDAAWEELLGGAYMEATEEEIEAVKKVAPWELEEINDHIYMEVGVFHNLHCIDLLRRALNPEYYNTHTDFSGQLAEKYRQTHIYHCIDHLRNAVSCHGDMTPVPLFTIPELPGFVASHSVSHTCRDFESIKAWKNERNTQREPYGY